MSDEKLIKLDSVLKELRTFVIGFSGGLDSLFLLYRANTLKNLKFMAVTIRTLYMPEREINEAIEFTSTNKIEHKILEISFPDAIRHNPLERCYICKKALFGKIVDFAENNGFSYVLDGTNADDKNDYRPGLRALRELKIISPLAEAGLTKPEIRKLAHDQGLNFWDKPAMACLLTRVPYETEISDGMLKMIEKAEDFLFELGFPGTRVRVHDETARIECLPGFITKLADHPKKDSIVAYFKKLGFRYVSLDLEGYRTGSMNTLKTEE